MNDDLPIKSPIPPSSASNLNEEQESVADRVFDIVGDEIKPISEDELAAPFATPIPAPLPKPVTPNTGFVSPVTLAPKNPLPNLKRTNPEHEFLVDRTKPIPTPGGDMLDKNIGSFQTTPFAPAKNAPILPQKQDVPLQPTANQRAYVSRPPNPISPPTIPTAPISYREPIPPTSSFLQTPTKPAVLAKPQSSWAPFKNAQQATNPIPAPLARPTTPPLVAKMVNPTPPTISQAPTKTMGKSLQEAATAALPSYLQQETQSTVAPVPPAQPASVRETSFPQIQSTDTQHTTSDPSFQNNLKPIRTYESDIAEIMARKKTSTASIVIAESKKQEGQEVIGSNTETTSHESSHVAKKLFLVILSLILLGGGAYGAYYLYSISPIAPVELVVPNQNTITSAVPAESQSVVTLDSESPNRIKSQLYGAVLSPQDPNTIKSIVVTRKNGTSVNRVSAGGMIKLLEIDAPDILTRSLTSDWMLGVYNNNQNKKEVFLVLTTNFFQNTFAGMLQWERVMADDIKGYLYPDNLEGISNTPTTPASPVNPLSDINSILPVMKTASTTATSSDSTRENTNSNNKQTVSQRETGTSTEIVESLRPYLTIKGSFEDRIVKNRDVRAFRTTEGEIIFLYSFIDNKSLVITGSEATLTEILTRLEKRAFIR